MTAPDAFDVGALAAHLSTVTRLQDAAHTLIGRHLDDHPRGYIAWSGGKDSTAVVHLAQTVHPSIPVCWFHSGLEFPETEQHIFHLAETWGVNLHVIYASPDALTLLADTGDWRHGPHPDTPTARADFHRALIGGPAAAAHTAHGPGEIVGLRAEESAARRRTLAGTGGRYRRGDGTAVCAPVWSWRGRDIHAYHSRHHIPLNPVYSTLRRVGAPPHHQRAGLVVDGNVLDAGAVTWLRLGWPEMWAQMVDRLPRLAEWR